MRERLLQLRAVVFHPAVPAVVTDLALLGYAAFTIVSQLTAIAGGTPRVLLPALLASAALLLVVLWVALARQPAWARAYLAAASAVPVRPGFAKAAKVPAVIAAGLLALVVCAAAVGPRVAWIPCALCAVWLAQHALRSAPGDDRPRDEPWWAVGLVYVCALIGAAVALLVVRPRSDDAFYLTMALSVFEAPDRPLLAVNSIHGPVSALLGPQRMFPPYRVHSFEVFGGALSQLLHVPPVVLFHLVLGPLLSFFAPFAIARALRLLTPAWWLGVCAVTLFYCIEGTASVGYANHAFVRMFHGKSVLLTAGVPLLIVHGLRFGERPDPLRFVLLVAAQIVAVGLSSTAIWLAPVVVLAAVLAGTPARNLLLPRALGSVVSSLYVLALGLWVFMVLSAASHGAAAAADALPVIPARLDEAVETALGSGRSAFGLLALLGLAIALSRSLPAFRLFAWLALCAAAFTTPPLIELVSRFITGVSTYHRLFWLLPIPLAFGVVVSELFVAARDRLPVRAALAVASVAAIALLAICTQRLVISEGNNAKLVYPPALKIGPRARGAALAVCEHLQKDEYVLASSSVSEQIATSRHCGHPLLTVPRWLDAPQAEIRQREELVRYISSEDDVPLERAQWFLQALARYRPAVVVTLEEAMKNRRMKLLLRWAGYEKAQQVEGNHVWVAASAWRKSEYDRVAIDTCAKAPPGAVVFAPFGVSRAIQRRGCAKPLFRAGAVYDANVDAVAKFERLLSSETELTTKEAAELRAMFAREHVNVVVVAPMGMGNGQLRVVLRDSNYLGVRGKGGHHVFIAAAPNPSLGPSP